MVLKLVFGCVSNNMWAVSKSDIWIWFPCRFVEGRGESSGRLFRLVWSNWLFFFLEYLSSFLFKNSFLVFTCVYFIYLIIIHWYWNLILVLLSNFQWDVSKPYIRNLFPCGFVEGHGEGVVFVNSPVVINVCIGFKLIITSSSRLLFSVLALSVE